jgi:hypothetical protein
MALFTHGSLVALQFLAILLTAAGWGYWLFRCFDHRRARRPEVALLCGIAGLCGCWLFLQDLVYLGLRLAWSAWIAAAIALLGVGGIWRWIAAGRAGNVGGWRPWLAPASVVFFVFGFQVCGVVYHGPHDYYGYASQDQVNYVQIAEFLIEKPYTTERSEVGLHPWLVKGIDSKGGRIGQSVANGYVAVVTGTDAKAAYGSVSVFFVALMAVSVLALLRCLGVGRVMAWLGGLWAGALPAVTQVHLDGFFSQTSTLFILPAAALAVHVARRNYHLSLVVVPLLLAFLLSAYSEIYVIGLALVLALTLVTFELRWPQKLTLVLTSLAIPPLVLAPYFRNCFRFLIGQYQAAAVDSAALTVWVPHAGTWRGWSQTFLVAPGHNAGLVRAQILAGFVILALILLGVFSRRLGRRAQLAVMAGVPAAVLAVLLSADPFPKYAFGKLTVCFAPLGVVLAVLGVCRLSLAWSHRLCRTPTLSALLRPKTLARWGGYGGVGLLLVLAAWASATKLHVVLANGAGLSTMNPPAAQVLYRELEAHPERLYLLTESHFILNAWLCYHARHASVYSAVEQIGDCFMSPDAFAFRHRPAHPGPIWEVRGWSMRPREEKP